MSSSKCLAIVLGVRETLQESHPHGFRAPTAFTLAPDAPSGDAPEETQTQEGGHIRGQDTAELFHFFKQAQARSASVGSEVSCYTGHSHHSCPRC